MPRPAPALHIFTAACGPSEYMRQVLVLVRSVHDTTARRGQPVELHLIHDGGAAARGLLGRLARMSADRLLPNLVVSGHQLNGTESTRAESIAHGWPRFTAAQTAATSCISMGRRSGSMWTCLCAVICVSSRRLLTPSTARSGLDSLANARYAAGTRGMLRVSGSASSTPVSTQESCSSDWIAGVPPDCLHTFATGRQTPATRIHALRTGQPTPILVRTESAHSVHAN